MFAHSIKGCRPLGRACGVLIPSPCVNTTPEPFNLKVRRSRLFRFFRRFPRINVGGDSARIPFLEDAPASHASPSRRRVGCDSWRLHWGLFFESQVIQSCAMFYHDILICWFPFIFLMFLRALFDTFIFCGYLLINFN